MCCCNTVTCMTPKPGIALAPSLHPISTYERSPTGPTDDLNQAAHHWACRQHESLQVAIAQLPKEPPGLVDHIHGHPLPQPDFLKQPPAVPKKLQRRSRLQLPSSARGHVAASKKPRPPPAAHPGKHALSGYEPALHRHIAAASTAAEAGAGRHSAPSSPATDRRLPPQPNAAAAAVHDQAAQQLPCPDPASGGARAALHAATAGQQGVLSKTARKAPKHSSPAGPSSGLNFWLQIHQAAANKPVEQSKAAKTQQVAMNVPGNMPASAVGPASEAETQQSSHCPKLPCPEARHDNPSDCDQLGRGHPPANCNRLAQRYDSCRDHKEDSPAIAQPVDADGDESDSSSESSQEMLALNRNSCQQAPSHVEVRLAGGSHPSSWSNYRLK